MKLSSVQGLHCHLPGVCFFFKFLYSGCRHVNLMQLAAHSSDVRTRDESSSRHAAPADTLTQARV